MRQGHNPKKNRVGFRNRGVIEQARTKGTTKLAKILSAPARCLPLFGGMAASHVDEILALAMAAFRQAAAKLPRVTARTALSLRAFRSFPG